MGSSDPENGQSFGQVVAELGPLADHWNAVGQLTQVGIVQVHTGEQGDLGPAGRGHGLGRRRQVHAAQALHHRRYQKQIRPGAHRLLEGFKWRWDLDHVVTAFLKLLGDEMGRGFTRHGQHDFNLADNHVSDIEARPLRARFLRQAPNSVLYLVVGQAAPGCNDPGHDIDKDLHVSGVVFIQVIQIR